MSMHTTQEWHGSAQLNMTQAGFAQKKSSRQCDTSKKAHDVTVSDNLANYNEVHGSLENKVKTSYRLIDKLQKRAQSIENSIAHTRNSLAALEAAHKAKEPPLELCKWRMEQREKRPLREQVRDFVETSLEEEKQTLVDTQRRLADAIRKTKAMLTGLETKLDEVRYDIDQKQQALGIDEMCLRTTHRSWQTVVERSPPSRTHSGSTRLPATGKTRGQLHQQVALHESHKNELGRQQDCTRLNSSAAAREDSAKELRDENQKLIGRCERLAEEAANKTERCLQDRINENQGMRRRIAAEIQETQRKIDNTKRTISETKAQIKALEEPMELTSTCASWRQQRATKEHITDPVSTKISEHQTMLLRSHEELKQHHEAEKAALQGLQERRERLKEDLRDKTAALHIDLNCLTHEAITLHGKPKQSVSNNKLHRAMKVDPGFVPVPSAVGSFGGSMPGMSGSLTAR